MLRIVRDWNARFIVWYSLPTNNKPKQSLPDSIVFEQHCFWESFWCWPLWCIWNEICIIEKPFTWNNNLVHMCQKSLSLFSTAFRLKRFSKHLPNTFVQYCIALLQQTRMIRNVLDPVFVQHEKCSFLQWCCLHARLAPLKKNNAWYHKSGWWKGKVNGKQLYYKE